jgi:hypothetical protein
MARLNIILRESHRRVICASITNNKTNEENIIVLLWVARPWPCQYEKCAKPAEWLVFGPFPS